MAGVTRKTIQNLIDKFSIGQNYKLDNVDAVSVEKFVIKDNGETVRLYKPMGTYDTRYPELEVDDFGLVIMNEQQAKFLQSTISGPTAILCVDSTHKTNDYNLKLTTLITVNSFGNGIPCAFFITTKEDIHALSFFFQSIKAVVGNLHPKVSF